MFKFKSVKFYTQGQVTPKWVVWFGPKSNSTRGFMPVLVTSNFDDDLIKNEQASMEFWPNLPKNLMQPFPHPSDATHRIWSILANLPQRYSSLKVWTRTTMMTMDDRPLVYYKLTLWAFSSGELMISILILTYNVLLRYLAFVSRCYSLLPIMLKIFHVICQLSDDFYEKGIFFHILVGFYPSVRQSLFTETLNNPQVAVFRQQSNIFQQSR